MSNTRERYSFSKLSTFENCPYGYYARYIEHKPSQNNSFAEFGSYCHSIFEAYAKGEYDLDSLADIYEFGYKDAITCKWPNNRSVDLESSYYEAGKEFFAEWEGYDESYHILGVEDEFTIQIEDFNLTGFLDLIYEKDGLLIIRDYKSKGEIKKAEQQHYARQLYIYSAYVKEKYGRFPDRLEFFCFRKNHVLEISFSEADYKEAIRWAINTVAKIRNEWEFNKTPSQFFCMNLCNVRGDCPYGRYAAWKSRRSGRTKGGV